MDAERIGEIRQRVEVATPGPWEWDAIDEGSLHTIDPLGDPVARKYGLRAQILGTGEYNRKTPNRADATFIANAREDVPYLLDLVATLTAEKDAAEDRVDGLRGALGRVTRSRDEWEGNYIETVAELSRLRAVIEEARYYLNRAVAETTYKEFNDDVLVAQDILDRGLKGVGDE